MPGRPRARKWIRLAAWCFVVLTASPIRYWPFMAGGDPSWVFVLNHAAAHGMKDIFFTYGPLGYLTFPQAFGNNLGQGLVFQACLWLFLAWEMACLFFRGNLPLRNLLLFSFFFALSTPLYWFNFGGVESLFLVVTLVELYLYRSRGSLRHYVFALIAIGITPAIKLSTCLTAAAVLAGFLADRIMQDGWKARRELTLALLVPAAVAGGVMTAALSGWRGLWLYLRASAELIGGFTAAMSNPGDWRGFVGAGPVLLSFKHGFVRQDMHVISYFGFIALATALVSLQIPLERRRGLTLGLAVVVLTLSWALVNFSHLGADTISIASGLDNAETVWNALRPARLHRILAPSTDEFDPESLIEPEIQAVVGNAPVASLSGWYSVLGLGGWNPRFYPVIQMYAAFTPYLDGLNAAWMRDHGPPFLIYNGFTLDGRDCWAANPATWLEIYRWYQTRWLGPRNLLLQRRATPRFTALDPLGRFTVRAPLSLSLPHSTAPVFWSLRCGNSLTGKVRKLLFRMAETEMRIDTEAGEARLARIIPEMLVTPVMGTYLPDTLDEFAAVFQPNGTIPAVREISFGGPGIGNYTSVCEAELWRPR